MTTTDNIIKTTIELGIPSVAALSILGLLFLILSISMFKYASAMKVNENGKLSFLLGAYSLLGIGLVTFLLFSTFFLSMIVKMFV
jgi:hypothetical protein